MTKTLRKALFVATSLFLSSAACSSELPGKWILTVENPDHVVVTTLKVEFTDKQARSCMSGEWKVVKVVSVKTQDKAFFPSSDHLSYSIEDNQLTIGRNELCDAYLWLRGPLGDSSVKGDYYTFGLGSGSKLGYFDLSKTK
ncbi:hypothetical protein L2Y96_10585 [Luteibacter aegosomaticola]|uniref:hypothetical protein n=1 Tax=Luteibacter aegosomaticola TaxID=2911538 RepID=UPI001FFB7458|nr:hypothetical protein [Luteibacter aegosomaticola]UPG92185.1 hypothetical protein L2Y96_10585 [Luteibacter aegosomaticola]